ncbi:hypothetical protein Goklo_005750 [Gossypium klotzschianum]|uniref:Uncharacterized protein n=1 Tax=Gossypium klotzschianum TaxID=34286 RepID=A0A7J8VF93_9ROSI|nr:hypothetical protein [Gossypium klotzschianum]
MSRDDISLLEEELVHLTVKSSLVVPNGKSTLLRMKEDPPFSLALKVESNLIGKVNKQLGVTMKKSMPQHYYLGRSDEGMEGNSNFDIRGEGGRR